MGTVLLGVSFLLLLDRKAGSSHSDFTVFSALLIQVLPLEFHCSSNFFWTGFNFNMLIPLILMGRVF